jgi:hypothetical protein
MHCHECTIQIRILLPRYHLGKETCASRPISNVPIFRRGKGIVRQPDAKRVESSPNNNAAEMPTGNVAQLLSYRDGDTAEGGSGDAILAAVMQIAYLGMVETGGSTEGSMPHRLGFRC